MAAVCSEWFSLECHKTKTNIMVKVIVLIIQNSCKQLNALTYFGGNLNKQDGDTIKNRVQNKRFN